MSENETKKEEIHELAGGWITERADAPVPLFLKLAYVGFCIFGLAYLFNYWAGETGHATRGPLVQEINKVMQTPGTGFHLFIGVTLLAFVIGLFWVTFRRETH